MEIKNSNGVIIDVPKLVREIRGATGCSMMVARKALAVCDYDAERATRDILKELNSSYYRGIIS